ncbi:MAG: phosphatidylinositol mannoside acyltransferase [Acidimicrobiaceae bacterium]|nr:phosphatidylinositol mannoside acyltransferase [Acidimicrobiaceae bacterium]
MKARNAAAMYILAGRILERLPERFDVALARRIGVAVGMRSKARQPLEHNLQNVLSAPDRLTESALLERYVRRGFANYAQYWAEGAKLPGLSRDTINSRFRIVEGLEYLEEAFALGKGVVIALPHVGSWEWGGSYLSSLGMPMTAVAEELEPPRLFEWFTAKREAIGIHIEGLNKDASTKLLNVLKSGGVVGLLCDRDIQGGGVNVEFFGSTVTLPGGPATLALRTGAPLVCAACYTGPGRDHFAVITPPIIAEREGRLRHDVTRVTQAIADELEGLIRRAPEQWHVLEERFEQL